MQSKKLAFVYHTPFWIEKGKVVTSHAAVGRYVDSLAPYFSEIILAVPAPGKGNTIQYALESENLKLLKLPHYHNIQGFYFHAFIYFWKLICSAASWDVLNIRMATHLGFLAYMAAKFWKKPTFLVLVGEFYLYNNASNYPFLKQKIVNADSIIQDKLTKLMVHNCLTFTNGEELFEKFQRHDNHVFLMRSSTIGLEDIVSVSHIKMLHNPIRILTVATIVPRKGTILIPEIILILKQKGHDVEWHYIGEIEGKSGEQELQRTLDSASNLAVFSNLVFHGQLPWNELRQHYLKSDLFVLPTYMEGVPRVLLEAQAAGLPVITTTVGGIPKAIKTGYDGILVPPGDPTAIAESIEKIINHRELYCRLVKNGVETAKELSLQSETNRMLQQVFRSFYMIPEKMPE